MTTPQEDAKPTSSKVKMTFENTDALVELLESGDPYFMTNAVTPDRCVTEWRRKGFDQPIAKSIMTGEGVAQYSVGMFLCILRKTAVGRARAFGDFGALQASMQNAEVEIDGVGIGSLLNIILKAAAFGHVGKEGFAELPPEKDGWKKGKPVVNDAGRAGIVRAIWTEGVQVAWNDLPADKFDSDPSIYPFDDLRSPVKD